MLSNTCKYAIRAVIYIAAHAQDGQKIGIKKISEDLEIPTPFLGKILQTLAKQKLLSSTKGPNGGFGIGKDPNELTLLEIVEIVDGKEIFENCLISLRPCSEDQKYCPVHADYNDIREKTKKMFEKQTIGQMATKAKKNKLNIKI